MLPGRKTASWSQTGSQSMYPASLTGDSSNVRRVTASRIHRASRRDASEQPENGSMTRIDRVRDRCGRRVVSHDSDVLKSPRAHQRRATDLEQTSAHDCDDEVDVVVGDDERRSQFEDRLVAHAIEPCYQSRGEQLLADPIEQRRIVEQRVRARVEQIETDQEAVTTDLANAREIGESIAQRRAQAGALQAGACEQSLVFQDAEIGQRRGRRRRPSAERRAVSERLFVAIAQERVRDAARDDHRAERFVAAGQALRADEDVGANAVAFAAEPRAEPAEAADHLVQDQQGVACRAQPMTRRRGSRRRRWNVAAAVLHGLDDHRRGTGASGVFAAARDALAEATRAGERAAVRCQSELAAGAERVRHVVERHAQRLELLAHRSEAARGQCPRSCRDTTGCATRNPDARDGRTAADRRARA